MTAGVTPGLRSELREAAHLHREDTQGEGTVVDNNRANCLRENDAIGSFPKRS